MARPTLEEIKDRLAFEVEKRGSAAPKNIDMRSYSLGYDDGFIDALGWIVADDERSDVAAA